MPKFTVRRYQDAYVIQEAEIEADNAEAAARKAYNDDDIKDVDIEWGPADTQTFDATGMVTLDENGNELEDTRYGKLFW
jgi:hypothetical protein